VRPTLLDQLQTALGQAYVLERELGGGGMSHVFLALETALGRQVVVKVLLPELAAGVNVERFRREIQLAAQLQHPHIVPLLSAGEADGLPYFIMPFVTGESLRSRVAREGELPIAETLRILRDVVSALAYAHARGIVHRDVKPDNVLLSGGVAVVTDFGVAKAVSASADSAGATGMTSLGVALGTPTYMSPEQASASPQTDHRADIYALGVMTYEMLTGMPPFTGRSPQAVLAAHVVEEPHPVDRRRPAVPPMLATLVHDCLAKSPADRPQSAADVMHVLDAIATPSGGTAPTTVVRAAVRAAGRAGGRGSEARETPVSASILRRRGPLVASLAVAAVLLVAGTLLLRRVPAPIAPAAPTAPSPTAPRVSPRPDPAVAVAPESSAATSAAQPAPPPVRTAPRSEAERTLPTGKAAARERKDTLPTARRSRDSAATRPAPLSPATDSAPVPPAVPPPAPEQTAPPPAAAAPAPAPPAPPEDPRPQVRDLIAEYARAVESESIPELRRVYPGMTSAQQLGWEQFFQLVRDVKAELSVGRLDVSNATAEAQVGGTYTYLNTSTQQTERQPVAFRATLRRDSGRWGIAQIR
jgi:tRNA A-37 threonylcarbamoyl transferase component Bud32